MRAVLERLRWDNRSLAALPLDPIAENYVRSPVPRACFSLVSPTPVVAPALVTASPDALSLLGGGDADAWAAAAADPLFPAYFSGNTLLEGARPAAHCYCGHQVGRVWVWGVREE
jgi:uncharacterized protein YdiU (UPF0061 family)